MARPYYHESTHIASKYKWHEVKMMKRGDQVDTKDSYVAKDENPRVYYCSTKVVPFLTQLQF
jgi:hypothetical protein